MAQARVTDFFTSRKRNLDVQPSKRRKVLLEDAVRSETTIASNDKRNRNRTARSSTRLKATTCESAPSKLKANSKQSLQRTTLLSSVVDSPVEEIATIKSSKTTCKELISTEQLKTSDISPPAEKRDAIVPGDNKKIIAKDGFPAAFERKTDSLSTAACDDHSCSPSSTPTKRKVGNKIIKCPVKRSRVANTVARDLLLSLDSAVVAPEKGFTFKLFTKPAPQGEKVDSDDLGVESCVTSPRKKLQPHRRSTESSSNDGSSSKNQSSPCKFIFRGSVSPKVLETKKEITAECTPQVSRVTDCSLASATKDDKATKQVTKKEKTAKCEPLDSQTDDSSLSSATKEAKSTKQELRLDAASFKEKLKGCGQLSQLKERLAEFSRAAKTTGETQKQPTPKLSSPVKSETGNTESTKKAPAYERFHSLAAPVPPSLTLPYHYKILDEMFRGVDTVVSMLHQRSELCTFNKLKTAVQLMVRRTFDLKNLGRIKTVYPKAYTFRQEKGLPCFGGRTAGYQLTVEANLEDKQKDVSEVKVKSEKKTETKRQNFTAAELLARKTTFHKGLIDIVKKHHREFLSNLERPLSVPDHKITRWHPKFQCDEVPAVDPAPLPLPPDTATFATAKDALEQARNKFTPRVQKALEIVSAASTKKDTHAAEIKTAQSNGVSNKTSSNNSLQGVPQSLLERIRAKEERKLENEMTRTPAQTKHIDAISRLPELVRILRTFFVTQKKVALPVDDVVQKLSDSYTTSLGRAESERHLKLMVELLPEWIEMVTVKRGRFIKIDKHLDVQRIYAKLQSLLKEST